MSFVGYVRGDKFPREIQEMDTPWRVGISLEARGYEPQLYTASRDAKRGKRIRPMFSMVYREKETGEFVFAW